MTYFEAEGSAYEIGRRQCERHGDLAKLWYRAFFHRHADEAPEHDVPAVMKHVQEHWPAQYEEVQGYADGLGMPFEQVCGYHFGAQVAELLGTTQCSNLGFRTSANGPLLGGNLDDVAGYMVQRTRRSGAFAHVGIVYPGLLSYFAGVNECGLAVSGSSARVRTQPAPPPEQPPAFQSVYTARLVLETCRDVPEAVALLRQPGIPGHGNHIMVDESGNGVVIESHKPTGPVLAEHDWQPGGWICCGNFFTSELSMEQALTASDAALRDRGNRVCLLREAGARSEITGGSIELLMETLRTHDGPEHGMGGICNPGNCLGIICVPRERRILVAERFPCANEFEEFSLG